MRVKINRVKCELKLTGAYKANVSAGAVVNSSLAPHRPRVGMGGNATGIGGSGNHRHRCRCPHFLGQSSVGTIFFTLHLHSTVFAMPSLTQ